MEHPSLRADERWRVRIGGKAGGHDGGGERFITVRDGDAQLVTARRDPPLHERPRYLGSGRARLDVELAATVVAVDAGPPDGIPTSFEDNGISQLPSCRGPAEAPRVEAERPKAARQPLHGRRVVGSLPRTQLQGHPTTVDGAPGVSGSPLVSGPDNVMPTTAY
ncbi:MAG: hypothetical protein ACRDZX_09735 [Acidimicrobiales bacterium]